MDRDNLLVVIIATVLVAAIAIPFVLWRARESNRPVLREARIVIATAADPVFREGPRHVGPDEAVEIAVALLIERPGQGTTWLAPVSELVLGGERVEPMVSEQWPEDDRWVRVFWFTAECALVGGDLTEANAAERLHYRSFLAAEMGHGLRAAHPPEAHNEDFLGDEIDVVPMAGGTLRLLARVEVVARPTAARVEQGVSTIGVEHVADPGFPAIHRAAPVPEGIRPEVGELFLLPGYEPRATAGEDRERVTEEAFGRPFSSLVEQRLVCSSRTFAAVAATGTPVLAEDALGSQGRVSLGPAGASRRGHSLRWGDDVVAGDLLVHDDHWMVLLRDDGSGALDPDDEIMQCWRRPPAVLSLGVAMGGVTGELDHLRVRPAGG